MVAIPLSSIFAKNLEGIYNLNIENKKCLTNKANIHS